jgi:Icc-related predicted phosphoesterase
LWNKEAAVSLFGNNKKTRIFFTTDVHGSTVVFKKFINSAKFYEAQVIVLGGDMVGKMIIPFVEQKQGYYHVDYLGKVNDVQMGPEMDQMMLSMENSGLYPLRITPDEVKSFDSDKNLVEKRFAELAKQRISNWLQIADERLKGTGISCFIQPGNDDPYEIDSVFSQSSFVKNVDNTIVSIDEDHEMLSIGAANPTPWHCPRDIPEDELFTKIDRLGSQLKNPKTAVFNLHVPPFDTNLDIAPELDDNLTPKLSLSGGFKMVPVGSKAVRQAIEKYQPLLGLHGHIHESRSAQNLGKTVCINPGSEYGEGVLRGVIVDISKKGLENYMFTQG